MTKIHEIQEILNVVIVVLSFSFSNSLLSSNDVNFLPTLRMFCHAFSQEQRARKILKPSREKTAGDVTLLYGFALKVFAWSSVSRSFWLTGWWMLTEDPPWSAHRVSRVGVEGTAMIYNPVGERDFRQVATFTMTRENEQFVSLELCCRSHVFEGDRAKRASKRQEAVQL